MGYRKSKWQHAEERHKYGLHLQRIWGIKARVNSGRAQQKKSKGHHPRDSARTFTFRNTKLQLVPDLQSNRISDDFDDQNHQTVHFPTSGFHFAQSITAPPGLTHASKLRREYVLRKYFNGTAKDGRFMVSHRRCFTPFRPFTPSHLLRPPSAEGSKLLGMPEHYQPALQHRKSSHENLDFTIKSVIPPLPPTAQKVQKQIQHPNGSTSLKTTVKPKHSLPEIVNKVMASSTNLKYSESKRSQFNLRATNGNKRYNNEAPFPPWFLGPNSEEKSDLLLLFSLIATNQIINHHAYDLKKMKELLVWLMGQWSRIIDKQDMEAELKSVLAQAGIHDLFLETSPSKNWDSDQEYEEDFEQMAEPTIPADKKLSIASDVLQEFIDNFSLPSRDKSSSANSKKKKPPTEKSSSRTSAKSSDFIVTSSDRSKSPKVEHAKKSSSKHSTASSSSVSDKPSNIHQLLKMQVVSTKSSKSRSTKSGSDGSNIVDNSAQLNAHSATVNKAHSESSHSSSASTSHTTSRSKSSNVADRSKSPAKLTKQSNFIDMKNSPKELLIDQQLLGREEETIPETLENDLASLKSDSIQEHSVPEENIASEQIVRINSDDDGSTVASETSGSSFKANQAVENLSTAASQVVDHDADVKIGDISTESVESLETPNLKSPLAIDLSNKVDEDLNDTISNSDSTINGDHGDLSESSGIIIEAGKQVGELDGFPEDQLSVELTDAELDELANDPILKMYKGDPLEIIQEESERESLNSSVHTYKSKNTTKS